MRKYYSIFLLLLILAGCSRQYLPASYAFKQIKLTDGTAIDSSFAKKIQPFKDSLDAEMNTVVAISAKNMVRAQPESDLGNLMTNIMFSRAKDLTTQKVDFAVMNYGGIRIPELPAGNITRGKVFELMPFDNRMVLQTIDGKTAQDMFNQMAKLGGWPVAGATYVIKEGKAENVAINNTPLNPASVYTFAVSDYLAGGGDKMDMLKNKPFTDLKITIRDVLMEGFTAVNKEGKQLTAEVEGRVTTAK